jgi:hypothetical protein
MKLKWLVIMLATFAIVFVQAGLKAPSAYADSLPAIPPVVNGVVEVSTPVQLSYIDLNQSQYQSSTIKLMNNLDMTGYSWWGPILNFSGVFDGNGYDISNLRISQPAQDEYGTTYMGMFATTTYIAIIKNLTLSNCIVTGNAWFMGALIGLNEGNISHVGIIGGSVHQTGVSATYYNYYAGGIAGESDGVYGNFIKISLRDSYSTSDVSGVDTYAVSGLTAAHDYFNMYTSYAAGSLTGGLVKFGIAQYNDEIEGDAISLYFNKDKTGTVSDLPYFQRSTQDMLNQSSFSGWDFQNTWSILPGKTYPFLKGMHSVTPSVLSPAFQNTLYSQKLQIPASSSAPVDLIWEAISLPPGLSLANDGTLSGTPTSFGSQSFTVVVYSPSTHIVYGSGTISLLINPGPPPKINPPTINNIDIVNNLAPTVDTVTVRALKVGDVIKVYDAPKEGNQLGQSPPVASGETSTTVSIGQLGAGAGQVYVSITINGNLESGRTAKAYDAEPVQTTAPLASNITVTNNPVGTPDTVLVNGLTTGDLIKVYDSATGGNLLSSATVPIGQTSVTTSVYQLGTTAGQVYVSATSTGKIESTRTAKAYEAEPIVDTIAPITKYHFDPIYETPSSGIRYIKGYTTTLRATDNVSGSGVKTTQYRINGGTWIVYTSPFTFYAGATHIVEYFSTDNAGNLENPMNVMDFDKGKFTGAGKF